MVEGWRLLLTSEHAGNRVPPEYADLFRGQNELLATHRGYDIGILPFARQLAGSLPAPLLTTEVTRLLVEANRSPHNHRRLFSEFTRNLPQAERQRIIDTYHAPHWERVRMEVLSLLEKGGGVLHIGLHSFTSELNGERRHNHFGLLYDPERSREREFCLGWKKEMERLDGSLRVRRNYPYPGVMDGLTTAFRRLFPEERYAGLELEINQELLDEKSGTPPQLFRVILDSLRAACGRFGLVLDG